MGDRMNIKDIPETLADLHAWAEVSLNCYEYAEGGQMTVHIPGLRGGPYGRCT